MAAAVAVVDLAEVSMEAVSAADIPADLPAALGPVDLALWEWAAVLCPWVDGTADAGIPAVAVAV